MKITFLPARSRTAVAAAAIGLALAGGTAAAVAVPAAVSAAGSHAQHAQLAGTPCCERQAPLMP